MKWIILVVIMFFGSVDCASANYIPRDAYRYQRDLIRTAHAFWGLDAPIAAFAGQVHQESAWNERARSPFAAGLTQFTPGTAADMGRLFPKELGQVNVYNPQWALRAMVLYMKMLYQRNPGASDCDTLAFAQSCYNGGERWLRRDQAVARARGSDPGRWFGHVELYNSGRAIHFFAENRGYPRNILLRWQPLYASWGRTVSCST